METEKVSFQSEGQRISGILHLPESEHPPCVIASHGLLSSKDTEKYTALGERLAREGLAMLRFDFRGCGESEGRMEESTVSGRIADLGSAIEFVKSHLGFGNSDRVARIKPWRLYLLDEGLHREEDQGCCDLGYALSLR